MAIDLAPLLENGLATTAVALIRGDESDLAVTMLAVVPIDEAMRPLAGFFKVLEARAWIRRNVFQCAEPRFDERVVVGGARSAVARFNTQFLQLGSKRERPLWGAIVGMQHQGLAAQLFSPASALKQFGCQLTTLAGMDLPGHQLAAVEIQDGIEVEEHPSDLAGQVRDVPAPDLVGCPGNVGRCCLA